MIKLSTNDSQVGGKFDRIEVRGKNVTIKDVTVEGEGIALYSNCSELNIIVLNMFKKFLESNRWKHFLYSIPLGLFFTIFFVIGINAGMEYKDDYYWGEWDWLDFIWGVAGGLIGQILQVIIILLII